MFIIAQTIFCAVEHDMRYLVAHSFLRFYSAKLRKWKNIGPVVRVIELLQILNITSKVIKSKVTDSMDCANTVGTCAVLSIARQHVRTCLIS